MDLSNALRVIGQNWIVLAIGLLLSGGVVWAIAYQLPPTYSASATVLLVPPPQGGTWVDDPKKPAAVANPYLSFSSSIYTFARVVTQNLQSSDAQATLRDEGATAGYQVVTNSDAPSLTVTATSSDPRAALLTMHLLVDAVGKEVASRQRETKAPPQTWVTVSPVSVPDRASETNARSKVLAVVVGLGLMASL